MVVAIAGGERAAASAAAIVPIEVRRREPARMQSEQSDMSSEHSKITFLPTADANRIFSRDEVAAPSPLPFSTAINRVAHAVSSDASFEVLLQEIIVSASRAIDADIGLI